MSRTDEAKTIGAGRCLQRRVDLVFWLLMLSASAVACGSDKGNTCAALPRTCPTSVPSYTATVGPLVQSRCVGCHSPDVADGPWPLSDATHIRDWKDNVLGVLNACHPSPPHDATGLTADERDSLATWLVCDAPDN